MLSELPGIGTDLAEKIKEIAENGHCSLLGRLHTELLPAITELGPKRVKALYHDILEEGFGFAGQRIRAA